MDKVWRVLRRAGYLALAIGGVAIWQLGCSSDDFGLPTGVRIDQLSARDLSVEVTETTAVFEWQTRDASATMLNYGLNPGLGTSVNDPAETTRHRVELSGLTADTLYYYQLTGSDQTWRFRTMGGARGRLAFVSDRADNRQEIYLSYENGENVRRVTTGGGVNPALSRDGTRLAYAAPGAGGLQDIYALTLDTAGPVAGSLVNLTDSPDRDEFEPDWSPDLAQVVYVAAATGEPTRLVVQEIASGDESVLVDNGATNSGPRWRPNGSQIAFASTMRSALVQLGIRPVTADSLTVTLNEGEGQLIDPSEYRLVSETDGLVDFSGSSVADRNITVSYVGNGTPVTGEGHHVPRPHLEIWSVAADGSTPRRLTNTGDRQAMSAPAWHPTQPLLLCVGEAGLATNLFAVDADRGTATGLTGGAYFDRAPAISPDGRSLVLSSDRNNDRVINLYFCDFSGRIDPLNLFSSGDTQPVWSVVP